MLNLSLLIRLDERIQQDERDSIESGLKSLTKLFEGVTYQIFDSRDEGSFAIIRWLKKKYTSNREKGYGHQINVENITTLLGSDPFRYDGPGVHVILSGIENTKFHIFKTRSSEKKYDEEMKEMPLGKRSYVKRDYVEMNNPITKPQNIKILYEDEEKLHKRSGLSVIVLGEDIFDNDTKFVIGEACENLYALFSVVRFRELKSDMKDLCIKIEMFHEIGHLFGAPPEDRSDLVESLGKHDPEYEKCVMRQGLIVPDHWIGFAKDYKKTGIIYCERCSNTIKKFVKKHGL
jgi:predicted Zn-dependent protease